MRIKYNTKPKNVRSKLSVHVGIRLNKLRDKYHMTMRAVSDKTGLSCAFICQVENGQSLPTAETLYKLSKCFNVSVNYFFTGYSG